MEPVSDDQQSCHSFHLAVSPQAEPFRYTTASATACTISICWYRTRWSASWRRASSKRTADRPDPGSSPRARFPTSEADLPIEVLDFLQFRGSVRETPLLAPLLDALRPPPGKPIADVALDVAHYIYRHFEYARDVTLATSPIDDVLRQAKGVCQDFAHLMIAVLRSFGVPARYVSGYIHRPNKESQSHAWCEVWLAGRRMDRHRPDERSARRRSLRQGGHRPRFHRRAAEQGRLPHDGHENRSPYASRPASSTRLPSLSWQEQLPPLNVPLQAILVRTQGGASVEEEAQQQQQ